MPRRRSGVLGRVLTVAGVLLVLALIASMFVYVPYWALLPGSTTPVDGLLQVPEADAHPSDGEVLFVTVTQRQETALRWFLDRWDDDVEILTREQLFGDQSPEESRRENVQAMTDSKLIATYVAFQALGYDVEATEGGAVVASIAEDVPAAAVLEVGDVIVEADGDEVHLSADLTEALSDRRPGDVIDLVVERAGEERPLDVELSSGEGGRPVVGIIALTDDDVRFEFPVDVSIESGRVGGPSAGLAFTLALVDELTPGELTGGRRIAATGTISLGGEVGEVGGVRQKAVAVRESGAELFLVPASLVDVARGEVGDDVEVVGVRTIDEALDALVARGGRAPEVQPSR